MPREALYLAAAVIRHERWRYSYGMKITPARIADYPIVWSDKALATIGAALRTAARIEAIALEGTPDATG